MIQGSSKMERESGIELLKIISIFFIVVSHVTQSLSEGGALPGLSEAIRDGGYFFYVGEPTTDPQHFCLALMFYFGVFCNNVFFICSFWFLVDSNRTKMEKALQMLLDVWVISAVSLVIYLLIGTPVTKWDIVKSLLPTTFSNHWFITCYILIYLIHPFLNWIIERMDRPTHRTAAAIASFIYMGICTLKGDLFFNNNLIYFIVLYFDVAYAKKYLRNLVDDYRLNRRLFLTCGIGLVVLVLATDIVRLHTSSDGISLLYWDCNQNPLIALAAWSLVNLAQRHHFVNHRINEWSKLTLIIYLLHTNLIFKQFYRPLPYIYIHDYFGYDRILLWVWLYAAVLFIISTLISVLYQKTLQRGTGRLSQILAVYFRKKMFSSE